SSLPSGPTVQVTYVTRDRFRQAAVAARATADELRTVARALKAAGGGVPRVTLALADGSAAAVTIAEWVVSFGGDPLVLNDAGSRAALEFLQGLWRAGVHPPRRPPRHCLPAGGFPRGG